LVDAVFVVDKPAGMTSHDVVARARRALGTREIGHAGTLDPMATGVLVLAVGEATKLVAYLSAADKEYETTIALGTATDTLDADGRVTDTLAPPADWRSKLDDALAAERARTEQIPPAFSAIHAAGERAHAKARRGEAVELSARPVRVHELEILDTSRDRVRARLLVSKGYYVRALARDLAQRLGTVGHLTELRRLRSGPFALADAVALAALSPSSPSLSLASAAARALPTAKLTAAGAAHARAGRAVPTAELDPAEPGVHAWIAQDGALVAIGEIEDGVGRVRRGFRAPRS